MHFSTPPSVLPDISPARGEIGSFGAGVRLLAILAFLFLPFATIAAELPALTGRVVDTARMIDNATVILLNAKLAAFEEKGSDQIVVATIPSLDGEAIEPYANRLFREWKLGQGGENNGILLLVARDDRKMRIEVGYGLEGTLTDLHSKLIIENTMVPAFRAGDFSGGIEKAVDDIIMVLEGNGAELVARGERNQPRYSYDGPDIETIIIALWFIIFFSAIMMSLMARIFGTKIGPGRYRWLGMEFSYNQSSGSSGGGGWSSGSSSGGWSSGGSSWSSGSSSSGGFSGGGGSSGGGGASGSW